MEKVRYQDISIIPQYAMSAMNPTKKIGKMVKDLVHSRGLNYAEFEAEFIRRIHPGETFRRYPEDVPH